MLELINPDLMSFDVTQSKLKNDADRLHTKIRIVTSNKLVQSEAALEARKNHERYEPNESTCSIEKMVPVNREILRVSAPISESGDAEFLNTFKTTQNVDFNLPMSLAVLQNKYGAPAVEVRCHEDGEDRTNIYVVAFPFNGMIEPIPQSKQYKIYKGLIATSSRPFYFNNRKYRKVLYLVIEPNSKIFDPEYKYYTDSIDIRFESFAIYTDRATNERKTNHEIYDFSIYSDSTTESWQYETLDGEVNKMTDGTTPLWHTYVFENTKPSGGKKPFSKGDDRPNNQKSWNNKNKDYKNNGGYKPNNAPRVSVNKNGIRREDPPRQQSYYSTPDLGGNRPLGNLDDMIKASGMYDDKSRNRDNWNKRNSGKKKKNRK